MENAGSEGLLPQLRLDDLLGELQSRLEVVLATRDRMRGLLEAVVAIGSGLELEAMLRRPARPIAWREGEVRFSASGEVREGAPV